MITITHYCCYYYLWDEMGNQNGEMRNVIVCVQELEESGWQMVLSVRIYSFIHQLPELQTNRCILRTNVIDLVTQKCK